MRYCYIRALTPRLCPVVSSNILLVSARTSRHRPRIHQTHFLSYPTPLPLARTVPQVVKTFRALHAQGVRLALVSNQGKLGGHGAAPTDATDLQHKVDKVVAALGVPVDFLCCTSKGDDVFRKPLPGEGAMWGRGWRERRGGGGGAYG